MSAYFDIRPGSPLTRTDYRNLDFVVMRFLMKLFCTSKSQTVTLSTNAELVLSSDYRAK